MTGPAPDPKAALKRQAAVAAATLVTDGMVVGLGTGSTAFFLIEALLARVRDGLRIEAIATSERSAAQARDGGIRMIGFADTDAIDLDIDGADEIEPTRLDLIKGLGGALFREKIVASAARRFVVIADDSKLVTRLGERTPVPVEVAPFGWEVTDRALRGLGATTRPRRDNGGSLFVTDGGNMILDCHMVSIDAPRALERDMRDIVGVIETGLFLDRAGLAIVAGADGIREITATRD